MPLFKCKSTCQIFGSEKKETAKFTSVSRLSVDSGTIGVYEYHAKNDCIDESTFQIVSKYALNSGLNETSTSATQLKTAFSKTPFQRIRLKYNPPAKVLLVFDKEDSQCNALRTASQKLNQRCDIAKNHDQAISFFKEHCHDIVIIDHRHSRNFDSDSLCRSLCAKEVSPYCIIAALIKKCTAAKGESAILTLMDVGFNKFLVATTNIGLCTTELLQMERSEVEVRRQLRAAFAVYTALDHCSEAIEVTDEKHGIMFANETCKALLGYSNVELVGKTIDEVHAKFKTKPSFKHRLENGMIWEGKFSNDTDQGKQMQLQTRVLPITNQGKTEQYVYIYTDDTRNKDRDSDATRIVNNDSNQLKSGEKKVAFRKFSVDARSFSGNRRQSILKKNSLIEAPITKVINLIMAAQENCPPYVSQSLEKVVEILRTSDLYNPLFQGNVRGNDTVTTDLLGGLLASKTNTNFRKYSGASISTTKSYTHRSSSPHSLANLTGILENSSIYSKLIAWDSWQFDVIDLERLTAKKPLLWLGRTVFESFDLCSTLECSEKTLSNWLTLIEANYQSKNTYHNSTHAADVLHASAYFLSRDRVKELIYDPMDVAACLIAAVVHDVDHPGRTSAFLCNTGNDLAILYNDQAVLENHHAALAFKLTMSDERVNIFSGLDSDSYKSIRHNIIDMVLATDMSKHFEHLAKFVTVFTNLSRDNDELSGDSGIESPEHIEKESENLTLVKRMLIKCADVSNPTRPLKLCRMWAKRIAEEYISQTEEEINQDLPVIMPVFNRASCNIPKSQTSFTEYFINDLFDAWDAFAEVPELIDNIKSNYNFWKDLEEKGIMGSKMPD